MIQLDEDRGEFVLRSMFDHPYITTKIMWIPDKVCMRVCACVRCWCVLGCVCTYFFLVCVCIQFTRTL